MRLNLLTEGLVKREILFNLSSEIYVFVYYTIKYVHMTYIALELGTLFAFELWSESDSSLKL